VPCNTQRARASIVWTLCLHVEDSGARLRCCALGCSLTGFQVWASWRLIPKAAQADKCHLVLVWGDSHSCGQGGQGFVFRVGACRPCI
jgi:hypothetical protein